jgi:hypothetical protein
MENITFRMEANFARLENADLCVTIQVEELEKGPGVCNIEVVASQEPQLATTVKKILEVLVHKAKAAKLDESDADIDTDCTIEVGEQVRKQGILGSSNKGAIMWDRPEKLQAGFSVAEIVAFIGDDVANPTTRIGDVPGVTGNNVNMEVKDSLASS